jgi:hypothetical protein
MPRINQALVERLKKELRVGKSQVYELIKRKMTKTHLDRHLAAVALAADHNINIAKYATSDQLATIRGVARPQNAAVQAASTSEGRNRTSPRLVNALNIKLDFVSNAELQEILRRDLAELSFAGSRGYTVAPKTCMVLSGSIAEALLLDRLQARRAEAMSILPSIPKKISNNPEDWDLSDMVAVAVRLSPPLLPDDAIAGANQLRQWRNLIHPGRELKDSRTKRIKPTPARARNALSFLNFIAEELAP